MVEIEGVRHIEGSLIAVNNSVLTTLAAGDLESVSDTVELSNNIILTNLTFPKLSMVDTILFSYLPAPAVVDLQRAVQQVSNVYIIKTDFYSIRPLTFATPEIANIQIVGNEVLTFANLSFGNITGSAVIADNGNVMELLMPNLANAYTLNISNVSALEAPSLRSVSGDPSIAGTSVNSLDLAELAYVGGSFNVQNNSQLVAINAGNLNSVQSRLRITDNEALEALDEMQSLSYVGEAINITGSIAE